MATSDRALLGCMTADYYREHDDDDVAYFAKVLGESDLDRIRSGLLVAAGTLRSAPPEQRSVSILEGPSLFAIFEALSSEAVLTDLEFMASYLDEPFRLVQTNRLLKLNDYVPAMGRFLFDRDQTRMSWAQRAWAKMKRHLTMGEFWWVVQEPLLNAARLAAIPGQDNEYLERFWQGVSLIVSTLNRGLITNCLRALELDIYRLALDHLPMDSPASRYILQIFEMLLRNSPGDFWDAMGAISPAAIVEGICNSPQFSKTILEAKEDQLLDKQKILSWVDPFMVSLKPASQLPACRALMFHLMERFQVNSTPMKARMQLYECGLLVLFRTLRKLIDERTMVDGLVGQVVISEIVDVIATKHITHIVGVTSLPTGDVLDENIVKLSLGVIEYALKLDCHCFKVVHDALEKGVTLHDGRNPDSQNIWKAVTAGLTRNRVALARSTLLGMVEQVGIEKFNVEDKAGPLKEKIQFNEAYDVLLKSISSVFERLSDFDPDVLATLFQKVDTASPLIAGLFAADQSIYGAAVEVVNIVSTQPGRRESLSYLLRHFFEPIMLAVSWTIRQIAQRKSFAPQPRMLKTCRDILEILCDSRKGILATKSLSDGEATAIQGFWQYAWDCLTVIFKTTEDWGVVNHKDIMKEFCRDTMQFAEKLFDQYSIFASAIDGVRKSENGGDQSAQKAVASGRALLKHPTLTMESMVKWLRLRDEFLAATLANLVCKILGRLGQWGMTIGDSTLFYIEDISVRYVIRTILTPQQLAQINRTLDEHLDRKDKAATHPSRDISASTKQSTLTEWKQTANANQSSHSGTPKFVDGAIDLDHWRSKAKIEPTVIEIPDDQDEIMAASRSVEIFKAQQEARRSSKLAIRSSKMSAAKSAAAAAAQKSFREKREQEKREKAARDQEQIARLKKSAARSGFDFKNKDPTAQAPSMMVSSESEADEEEEELDRELFGINKPSKPSEGVLAYQESKMRALKQAQQGPVKKLKQARNASDMRARLAPDLSPLHRTILSWDFFHNDIFPPNSDRDDYSLVTNTFRSSSEYQATFQPLLILEAWQSFVKSREETTWKTFEIKVVNRVTVDSFIEVISSMTIGEGRDLGLGEADIILMSKGRSPTQEPDQPHCLARVTKISRKKTGMEITYKVNPNNPLLSSLNPNATLKGVKVDSITPLEREYGALLGLQYYDLCDEIIKAKPSPILNYSEKQLTPIRDIYKLNIAQSKALKSAVDNDAFTLIQG